MNDVEYQRCARLLRQLKDTGSSFYAIAIETLRWRLRREDKKRKSRLETWRDFSAKQDKLS